MLNVLFVNPVVHEQGEVDSDLRCGQTNTGGKFHGGKHVLNQLFEVFVDVFDTRAGAVKHGVSRDDNVPNTHRPSLMSVA